jgi:signal transduction histidine kinase
LGLVQGDLARYRDGKIETFTFGDHPHARVIAITAASDGSILGATDFGVIEWKNGKQQILTIRNGLPCNSVTDLIFDNADNLWLYSHCGLIEIPKEQVQLWWEHPESQLKMKVFDTLDGMQPGLGHFNTSARTPDGRLWFANGNVLQEIDPAHIPANTLAPPVDISALVADRKAYKLEPETRLPALTRDLEIDYAALSYVAPQKVRFRYKLEGKDHEWQEPGSRRQAFYNDLRPGRYRFHVVACNNDGVWNDAGATLNFTVAPAWFQTFWFRFLLVAAALLIIWGIYRFRVRQIARAMSARFDERLAERTRMVRELHDTFLQTIQGSKLVADDALEHAGDSVRTRHALEQLSQFLSQATQEGRAALHSLRASTTETNDLAAAFRRALEDCRRGMFMETGLSVTGEVREMHPVVRDEVYRIGYEAIHNACVHSAGSRVNVALAYGQDLSLEIYDNGVGIDSAITETGRNGHFGLQGMRERAARIGARLTMVSSSNSGTEVKLIVPGSVVFCKPQATAIDKIKTILTRTD